MDFASVSRTVEGGPATIGHRVNGSACLEQQVRDGKIPIVTTRMVEGVRATTVHRVNGSACLEEQVHDGRIPSHSRIVEGVIAPLLQGQFVVKSRGKGEDKRRELLEERKGKAQLFWNRRGGFPSEFGDLFLPFHFLGCFFSLSSLVLPPSFWSFIHSDEEGLLAIHPSIHPWVVAAAVLYPPPPSSPSPAA